MTPPATPRTWAKSSEGDAGEHHLPRLHSGVERSSVLNSPGRIKGWIGRLALIAMGGVFLLAGGLKALDPDGFTEQVRGYAFVPTALASAVTYTLIPIEIA